MANTFPSCVSLLLLTCCCLLTLHLAAAAPTGKASDLASKDPLFYLLRSNITIILEDVYKAVRPEHGHRLPKIAMQMQKHLQHTYPCCKWHVVLYNRTDSDLLPPGDGAGAIDNTGCDIDVPPDSCAQTGGAVMLTRSLQNQGSPREEFHVVAFFRPANEAPFPDTQSNSLGQIIAPYDIALYIWAFGYVTLESAKTATDWTDFARHIITRLQQLTDPQGQRLTPLRGLLLLTQIRGNFGEAGREGGMLCPAVKFPVVLSNGREALIYAIALPPAPVALPPAP